MQLSNKKIFEYLSTAAVVTGLIFVEFELRQSNRIAAVDSVADVYEKLTGINEILMTDDKLGQLLTADYQTWEEIPAPDQLKLQSWNYYLLNTYITANIAYDNGIFEESPYLGLRNHIVEEIRVSAPALRQNWRLLLSNHPDLQNLDLLILIDTELKKYE